MIVHYISPYFKPTKNPSEDGFSLNSLMTIPKPLSSAPLKAKLYMNLLKISIEFLNKIIVL
ncbi:hypothetical protein CSA08_04525 [Candidatus Gracilibacteria bacterium]|nr:MAG: hypothetical protein CSA08_04525 [Candidatus Gracilibacteria bacterium]